MNEPAYGRRRWPGAAVNGVVSRPNVIRLPYRAHTSQPLDKPQSAQKLIYRFLEHWMPA
jgi:hypothetical protein